MNEWITELINLIGLIVGYVLMFYFGKVVGVNSIEESDRMYEVLYQKAISQRDEYRERYNNIHYVLENITEEDVKLLSNDNWNTIILKKKEDDLPYDWVITGDGRHIPIYDKK